MSNPADSLQIDVRASTQAFARDMAQMRASVDTTLVPGFARAGTVLESGLQTALRKGSAGFTDLRRVALEALDTIATEAAKALVFGPGGSGGGGSGGAGGDLGALVQGLAGFGLPGRATGGPVSPGRGYVVGENGPELFVPANTGRIEAGLPPDAARGARDVRVAITIQAPPGTSGPQALQQSSRQIASAVRRALRDA